MRLQQEKNRILVAKESGLENYAREPKLELGGKTISSFLVQITISSFLTISRMPNLE